MTAWEVIREILYGFLPAFVRAYFKRRRTIADSQAKGAADQRKADREADDEITAEARGNAEKIRDASAESVDQRLDRWRRIGRM